MPGAGSPESITSSEESGDGRGSWDWPQDPGFPITPEITKITVITDEMVAGNRIGDRVGKVVEIVECLRGMICACPGRIGQMSMSAIT
jgi:uncharacterized membrane protein